MKLAISLVLLSGLLAFPMNAQTVQPAQVNFGTFNDVPEWAVNQPLLLSANIVEPGTTCPTGTLTFYSNGLPLAPPQTVQYQGMGSVGCSANAILVGPTLSSAGTYALTARYSGDSNFPPLSSAVFTLTVYATLPRNVVTASPTSLTFPAGATTGNATQLVVSPVDNPSTISGYSLTAVIRVADGSPTPGIMPYAKFTYGSGDNYTLEVVSSAPTSNYSQTSRQRSRAAFPVAAFLLGPLMLWRRRFKAVLPVMAVLVLPLLLTSCGGVSPAPSAPTKPLLSSAGSYVVWIIENTGAQPFYLETEYLAVVPVTIQ